MPHASSAISCTLVSKKFSGKYAVHAANLTVATGSIHALVGENGAGKSTLLGLISGRLATDEGRVEVFGDTLTSTSPRAVRKHGLAVVYQELTMVPGFTAVQNVFLGQLRTRHGVTDDRKMRQRFIELCTDFDVEIDPDAVVRYLSVSQQQILEIIRGVQADSRILMLDEPSAALAEAEREVLYRILNRLRERGTTIIFVSHNLDEVLKLSDDITVMRDGEVVSSAPRAQWDKPALVRSMIGKDLVLERRTDRHSLGETSIEASDITLPGVLRQINLSARQGEIVGLWGLVGSGRTTLFRSLCGLEPESTGSLALEGTARPWPKTMRAAIEQGIVMVPESRRHALVMGMDAVANFRLGRTSSTRGVISPRQERDEAASNASFFGFDIRRMREPVRTLSGGNQQKILLAKWAGFKPKVFLVDEPTRGIDVGAKSEVLASLVRLAREGATIIVTSSELEEVLSICDRLLVLAHGEVIRELSTVDGDYSVEQIVKSGFGESA